MSDARIFAGGTVELHDVTDAEQFCRRVVADTIAGKNRGRRMYLTRQTNDDLVTYLVESAFELSLRFDPERGQAFSSYAYRILRLRVADFFREQYGVTRRGRKLPELVSIDAPNERHRQRFPGSDGLDERDHPRRVDTLASSALDPAECLSPDLTRLLRAGGGGSAEPSRPGRAATARAVAT